MPRSQDHLNDKQIAVLRWVARGAPTDAYPAGSYAHRITAKALSNRGLVRIEGQGKTWRVMLTADGARRAEALTCSTEEHAQTIDDRAVINLLRRVDEAGGSLVVNTDEDDIDLRFIATVNSSEHRPFRKKLVSHAIDWREPWLQRLQYDDWFWDVAEAPSVAVVDSGSRLGPIAKAFLESKTDQFVTKEVTARASRVLEAVARHATKAGMTVQDPRPIDERKQRHGQRTGTWSGHVEIDADGFLVRLQIREVPGTGGKKFDYYGPDGKFDQRRYDEVRRLPGWQQHRNYWFVPTGKLELRLAHPGFSFDRLKWTDTKTLPLEQRLGEVFRYIEVERLQAQSAARRAAEAKVTRAAQWEAAMTEGQRHQHPHPHPRRDPHVRIAVADLRHHRGDGAGGAIPRSAAATER